MTAAPTGVFVTLEGGEGAGKSSLARRLVEALSAQHEVVATREPGGSPGADAVRALLVTGAADRWSPQAEMFLLAAARRDHYERTIGPALARGAIVICDRFRDSTRAYQVAGRGLDRDFESAVDLLIAAPRPDVTVLLDIDPEIGLARSRGVTIGEARFEGMDIAFHQRVRAAFLEIAQDEPARMQIVSAHQHPDAVYAHALAIVTQALARLTP